MSDLSKTARQRFLNTWQPSRMWLKQREIYQISLAKSKPSVISAILIHPPGERMVPAPQFPRSFRGTLLKSSVADTFLKLNAISLQEVLANSLRITGH